MRLPNKNQRLYLVGLALAADGIVLTYKIFTAAEAVAWGGFSVALFGFGLWKPGDPPDEGFPKDDKKD